MSSSNLIQYGDLQKPVVQEKLSSFNCGKYLCVVNKIPDYWSLSNITNSGPVYIMYGDLHKPKETNTNSYDEYSYIVWKNFTEIAHIVTVDYNTPNGIVRLAYEMIENDEQIENNQNKPELDEVDLWTGYFNDTDFMYLSYNVGIYTSSNNPRKFMTALTDKYPKWIKYRSELNGTFKPTDFFGLNENKLLVSFAS